jgi:hypothetical protein
MLEILNLATFITGILAGFLIIDESINNKSFSQYERLIGFSIGSSLIIFLIVVTFLL